MNHENFIRNIEYIHNLSKSIQLMQNELDNTLDSQIELSEEYIENNEHYKTYEGAVLKYYFSTSTFDFNITNMLFRIMININGIWISETVKITDFKLI